MVYMFSPLVSLCSCFSCVIVVVIVVVNVGVFEELLSQHLPNLHHHLLKLQVLTMVSLSWFLTVYLSVVPYSSCVVLLDLFFLHGTKVK